MNPQNKKSLDLDQDSHRNHLTNMKEISEIEIHEKPKLKLKLTQIKIRKFNVKLYKDKLG